MTRDDRFVYTVDKMLEVGKINVENESLHIFLQGIFEDFSYYRMNNIANIYDLEDEANVRRLFEEFEIKEMSIVVARMNEYVAIKKYKQRLKFLNKEALIEELEKTFKRRQENE